MMSLRRSQWELLVVVVAGILGLLWFGYVMTYARAAVRDDLRLDDLTNLRRALEMYYNVYNFYVTAPSGESGCTDSADPDSWFFGSRSPLLTDRMIDAIPHDHRESHGFVYTYCATDLVDAKTQGYYLDARLENDRPLGSTFDEDERRKFYYRIMNDTKGQVIRICGGTEKQCEAP